MNSNDISYKHFIWQQKGLGYFMFDKYLLIIIGNLQNLNFVVI